MDDQSDRKCIHNKNMSLRRSQRTKSINIKLNINTKIKKILSGNEQGIIIECYGEKGKGIKATKTFLKDDFVCEYNGEMCDKKEAERKEAYYGAKGIGCYMFYFHFKGKKYCIDATDELDSSGNVRVGRLINHSKKNSNCTPVVVEWKDKPKIVIKAKRKINEGEELSYDYGDRSKQSIQNYPWLKN